MSDSEKYDAIIIGSGKGGKILATYLGKQNHKVTLIERDPMMIGGGCINVACIPTKTFIASARLVHSIRRAAEFGVKVEGVSVDWLAVKQRVEAVVSEMRALNLKNFTSVQSLDFILGTGRFLGPQEVEVVETTANGFIKVNDRLETNVSGIWAIGDVSGGPQFTHASLDDFRILRDNVFGNGSRSRKDRYVPSTLFTDPELAHVGLTEKAAAARGLEFRVLQVPITPVTIPRARTTGQMDGLLKATIEKSTQRILGCTILAAEAGEMIGTVQAVMIAKMPATTLRDAVLSHPTMVEGFNALFAAL